MGKTGLASGILLKALQNGHRGLFIRAQDLFDEMYASLADRSSRKLINRLARIPVLLIDELGYLNIKPEQTNIFFKLMEERYNRFPTIITTNLDFPEWQDFLGNPGAGGGAAEPPAAPLPHPPHRRDLAPGPPGLTGTGRRRCEPRTTPSDARRVGGGPGGPGGPRGAAQRREMLWRRDRALEDLPLAWARAENAHGAEIYIRPARGFDWPLVFLDDVAVPVARQGAVDPRRAGRPTSPAGGCHLWLPCDRGLDEAPGCRPSAARGPVRCGQGSVSGEHLGRLAGFRNWKRAGCWVNMLAGWTGHAGFR